MNGATPRPPCWGQPCLRIILRIKIVLNRQFDFHLSNIKTEIGQQLMVVHLQQSSKHLLYTQKKVSISFFLLPMGPTGSNSHFYTSNMTLCNSRPPKIHVVPRKTTGHHYIIIGHLILLGNHLNTK